MEISKYTKNINSETGYSLSMVVQLIHHFPNYTVDLFSGDIGVMQFDVVLQWNFCLWTDLQYELPWFRHHRSSVEQVSPLGS